MIFIKHVWDHVKWSLKERRLVIGDVNAMYVECHRVRMGKSSARVH